MIEIFAGLDFLSLRDASLLQIVAHCKYFCKYFCFIYEMTRINFGKKFITSALGRQTS